MIHALYSLALTCAQPLVRAKLRRRATQEPLYGEFVDERFGHYAQPPQPPGELVWIHAVSLGETRAAAILAQQMRQRHPGLRLLLTHGTATGREAGAKLLQPGDVQVWQPWDAPGPVQRFLRHFQPRIGILMETEIWPNLAAACARQGVPLVLANARLSDSSLRRSQQLAWLARPAYRRLTQVWAQTADDARRLQLAGAQVTGVMGNLKFDATPDADQLARAEALRQTWKGGGIVLFASSREGEELQLVESLKKIKIFSEYSSNHIAIKNRPEKYKNQAQIILVPRHPQRFDEVERLLKAHGYGVIRRSDWGGAEAEALPVPQPQTLWLGDSMGEMALYYGLADAALLGGSFATLGGQNLIEAAACGCPVVMGPHTFNFAEAAEQALAEGAARRVADMDAGLRAAQDWLGDADSLRSASEQARGFATRHQGATQRLLDALQPCLG
ncbi:MAG: hypothetical protein RLZZ126_1836 [Pseudomonadota bacterium]